MGIERGEVPKRKLRGGTLKTSAPFASHIGGGLGVPPPRAPTPSGLPGVETPGDYGAPCMPRETGELTGFGWGPNITAEQGPTFS